MNKNLQTAYPLGIEAIKLKYKRVYVFEHEVLNLFELTLTWAVSIAPRDCACECFQRRDKADSRGP